MTKKIYLQMQNMVDFINSKDLAEEFFEFVKQKENNKK